MRMHLRNLLSKFFKLGTQKRQEMVAEASAPPADPAIDDFFCIYHGQHNTISGLGDARVRVLPAVESRSRS